MELQVKFQQIRNKIKVTLPVKMFCNWSSNELPHSFTLDKNDGLIVSWLGRKTDTLFKKSSVVLKKVNLNLAYDRCDTPRRIANGITTEQRSNLINSNGKSYGKA